MVLKITGFLHSPGIISKGSTSVLDGNNCSVASTDRFAPGETVSDILLIESCVGLRGDLDMLGMREMLSLTVT